MFLYRILIALAILNHDAGGDIRKDAVSRRRKTLPYFNLFLTTEHP